MTGTAAELDAALPELFLLRGLVHFARARIVDAVRELRLALDADPNNPDALVFLSNCYMISGRADRARPLIEHDIAVDPLNPIGRALRGWVEANEGRYAAAVGPYREMLDMDPRNPMARLFYGWILICAGRREEAGAVLGGFGPDVQDSMAGRLGACLRAALAGSIHDELSILAGQCERIGTISDLHARFLACCYGLLGDADRAVYWLRIAADRGFINYPFLAEHDVSVATVRDDPGCQAFLRTVRERWERFEA